MTDTYKPGEKPEHSGQFIEVGPRGGKQGNEEITGIENKPLPATSKPGNLWKQIDKTKHKE